MNNDIDDINIEMREPAANKSGTVTDGRVKIFIDDAVRAGIEEYSASDTTKELGGIILGQVLENGGITQVNVEGYIIARYTDAKQASLTFTHESWEQMHADREKKYPHLKIVGWFHTHPGFGIFLSSYDVFIHKGFFDLPWQIAYVVDPIRKTRGFFRWEKDDLVKAEYKVTAEPDEDNVQAAAKSLPQSAAEPAALKPDKPAYKSAVLVGMVAVALAASAAFWWQGNKAYDEAKRLVATKTDEPVGQVIENKADETDGISIAYRVQSGDTLSRICRSFCGNEMQIEDIVRLNGIKDPNQLNDGMILKLPASKAKQTK